MRQELNWIEAIGPDLLISLRQRYQVLQFVNWMAPVGRRSLANSMNLSERVLRTETDFLRTRGLIEASKSGMILTENGRAVFNGLSVLMNDLTGNNQLENALSSQLGIQHCIVVSGDSDDQPQVLGDMGQSLNGQLMQQLPVGENIIAIMGGTTMAQVAKDLSPRLSDGRQLIFVPARGGIGESVEIQANSVAAAMAVQVGGKHRVLYIPEQVSEKTYEPLLKEPSVQAVLKLVDKSNVVIHSIGEAVGMAKRRNMTPTSIRQLQSEHAVGEAFGYFFNEAGEVVYKIPRIGLQLKDLVKIPYVYAVAGGHSKAKAIVAYMKNAPKQTCLITDVGAANLILKGEAL